MKSFPKKERLMVDVLRQIVKQVLPVVVKKRFPTTSLSFYGKKGICIIWPATVPRGGIKRRCALRLVVWQPIERFGPLSHTWNQQANFL